MFEKLLNAHDANHFAKSLSPFFNWTKYHEERQKSYRSCVDDTIYTAKDRSWELKVSFRNRTNNGLDKKHYYPEITFNPRAVSMTSLLKEQSHKIADFLETKYAPDYDQITKVLDIFVSKGIESGLIHKIVHKKYAKKMTTHFGIHRHDNKLEFKDKNIATVSFNNILQKGSGKHSNYFKKSFINVEIIHLVQPDDTIQPYFMLKLPYSANNKITCVIPLNNADKFYFSATEEPLKTGYLRKLNTVNMNSADLNEYFGNLFKTEVRNVISETLKMRLTDLYNLTTEELKEYFVLVEMIKI